MGLQLRFVGPVLLGGSLSSGGLHAEVIHVPADEPTIQAGIDAAVDGDEVVVADGLYTGHGNRAVSTGTKLITVRSAGGPGACVIDCEFQERGFSVGGAAVVEGFTIRNGQADVGGRRGIHHSQRPSRCWRRHAHRGRCDGRRLRV